MGLMDRQTGFALAATSVLLSPDARRVARRGVVYGVAGALKAGELVAATARGAARGAQAGMAQDSDPRATTGEEAP